VIRVLIADDHGVVRDGLGRLVEALPDMELVGLAADGEEAVSRAREAEPDVILMDLDMPRLDGIEATRQVLADRPKTAVLVLTSFSDRPRIMGALEAGADALGHLVGLDVLEQVARRAARTVLTARAEPDPLEELSAREREVLGLLLEGLPNKLIARRLEITEKTVKSHLTRIFREIGVTDRTQAALWAERHGLTPGAQKRR